jgi:uroporphyrinogen-III synthase
VVGSHDWRGKRVLVLRGQTSGAAQHTAGRDWLAQQFRAAGAQVEMLSVYERKAPQLSSAELDLVKAASQDGSVWLFSSSEALANLLRQPALNGGVNWCQARAIATHPRIAEALRNAGWGVVQESRPMLSDIVDALR